MDLGLDSSTLTKSADQTVDSGQPADRFNLVSPEDKSTSNITSRRSRKQPQPTRMAVDNAQNSPEKDFTFTCYQMGLSPQSAPNEVTVSKSKGLKEMIGAAFKRLSV